MEGPVSSELAEDQLARGSPEASASDAGRGRPDLESGGEGAHQGLSPELSEEVKVASEAVREDALAAQGDLKPPTADSSKRDFGKLSPVWERGLTGRRLWTDSDLRSVVSDPGYYGRSSAQAGTSEEEAFSFAPLILRGVEKSLLLQERVRVSPAPIERQRETFLCLVCCENKLCEDRCQMKGCQVASHQCCVDCTAQFFRGRIQHGRVFELFCPVGAAGGGCQLAATAGTGRPEEPARAGREDVLRCLQGDAGVLEKYERFLLIKGDWSLRECPDCGELCGPTPDPDGRPKADVVCGACSSSFCYYHSAAHRGSSCEAYELRLANETRGIAEMFGAKECPVCRRQTTKSGGCNHMTCQACRCNWCWICGKQITERGPHGQEPIFWHYSEDNANSGCQKFSGVGEHPAPAEVMLRRRLLRPTWVSRALLAPIRLLSVLTFLIGVLMSIVVWAALYIALVPLAGLMDAALQVFRYKQNQHRPWARTHWIAKPTLQVGTVLGSVIFMVMFFMLTLAWETVCIAAWLVSAAASFLPVVGRRLPRMSEAHLRFCLAVPAEAVSNFGSQVLARMFYRNDAQLTGIF